MLSVSLLDITNPLAKFEVGNAAIADFSCTVDKKLGVTVPVPMIGSFAAKLGIGVREEKGANTFSFGAKVIRGHVYEFKMDVMCKTTTGVGSLLFSLAAFTPDSLMLPALPIDNRLDIGTPEFEITLGGFLPFTLFDIRHIGSAAIPAIPIPSIPISDLLPSSATDFFKRELQNAYNGLQAYLDASLDNRDGFVKWEDIAVSVGPDLSEEARQRELRARIEENLGNREQQAAVGLFTLPAALGGHLELSRQILVETLNALAAAGQSIGGAQRELNAGDRAAANGAYKVAYDHYRRSYQAAFGPSDEDGLR